MSLFNLLASHLSVRPPDEDDPRVMSDHTNPLITVILLSLALIAYLGFSDLHKDQLDSEIEYRTEVWENLRERNKAEKCYRESWSEREFRACNK